MRILGDIAGQRDRIGVRSRVEAVNRHAVHTQVGQRGIGGGSRSGLIHLDLGHLGERALILHRSVVQIKSDARGRRQATQIGGDRRQSGTGLLRRRHRDTAVDPLVTIAVHHGDLRKWTFVGGLFGINLNLRQRRGLIECILQPRIVIGPTVVPRGPIGAQVSVAGIGRRIRSPLVAALFAGRLDGSAIDGVATLADLGHVHRQRGGDGRVTAIAGGDGAGHDLLAGRGEVGVGHTRPIPGHGLGERRGIAHVGIHGRRSGGLHLGEAAADTHGDGNRIGDGERADIHARRRMQLIAVHIRRRSRHGHDAFRTDLVGERGGVPGHGHGLAFTPHVVRGDGRRQFGHGANRRLDIDGLGTGRLDGADVPGLVRTAAGLP